MIRKNMKHRKGLTNSLKRKAQGLRKVLRDEYMYDGEYVRVRQFIQQFNHYGIRVTVINEEAVANYENIINTVRQYVIANSPLYVISMIQLDEDNHPYREHTLSNLQGTLVEEVSSLTTPKQSSGDDREQLEQNNNK